jgi:hypothetical protein
MGMRYFPPQDKPGDRLIRGKFQQENMKPMKDMKSKEVSSRARKRPFKNQ